MRFDCVHPQVREDKDRGIYVEGLTEHPVDAPDAVLALVHESATNRATCGTSMNRTSSRSHALLLLRVEQWTESTDEAAADLAAIQTGDEALSDRSSVVSASAPRIAVRRGLLSIVDLAGSERVCKSGSEVRLSPPISPPISAQSRPNLACNLGLISPPISPRSSISTLARRCSPCYASLRELISSRCHRAPTHASRGTGSRRL
jgi:hypothetical protein